MTGVTTSAFALATVGTAATIAGVSGGGATWTVTTGPVSGSGSIGLNLTDGSNIKDSGGSAVAGTFTGQTYTVSAAATSAPVITGLKDAASDTGTSATDNITKNQRPTIVGTAAADATIELFDGGVSIGTTSSPTGSWEFTPTANLAESTHAITAKATINTVTSGPSNTLSLVIDITAPAPLTVSFQSIQGHKAEFTGTAGTAQYDATTVTVDVCTQIDCSDTPTKATLTGTVGAGGTYTTGQSGNLGNDNWYYARASQTDLAGNMSTATTARFQT